MLCYSVKKTNDWVMENVEASSGLDVALSQHLLQKVELGMRQDRSVPCQRVIAHVFTMWTWPSMTTAISFVYSSMGDEHDALHRADSSVPA